MIAHENKFEKKYHDIHIKFATSSALVYTFQVSSKNRISKFIYFVKYYAQQRDISKDCLSCITILT